MTLHLDLPTWTNAGGVIVLPLLALVVGWAVRMIATGRSDGRP